MLSCAEFPSKSWIRTRSDHAWVLRPSTAKILLSQRVNVALRGSVATEQVGALALKGLTQPTVAYNVPLVGSQAAFRVIEGGAPSA